MKSFVRVGLFVIGITVLSPRTCHAQTATVPATAPDAGEIRGRIVNAANKAPIDAGTVDVVKPGSDVVIARGVVALDGHFRAQGIRPGRYQVRIRAIGYAPRELQPIVMTSTAGVDVGTLELTAAANQLQSVVVTAPKQEVLLAPDRNTYAVRDMATTRVDGEFAWIGITAHAVSHLSDLVYLDLPEVGQDVMQNEPFGEVLIGRC